MNLFRFAGDMCHLVSFMLLLQRLRKSKTANGISLRTQELLALVFICRYLDLFTTYYSLYNSVMKVIYISVSVAVVYTLKYKEPWRTSYDSVRDDFPHWKYLAAPCFVLALVINDGYLKYGVFAYAREILWTFSEYLEAVAIIPQLVLLQRLKEVENLTSNYVFAIGAYRALYILNWIYRFLTTPYYRAYISWCSGVVQTALFVDFFYYYAKSKWAGMDSVPLPT